MSDFSDRRPLANGSWPSGGSPNTNSPDWTGGDGTDGGGGGWAGGGGAGGGWAGNGGGSWGGGNSSGGWSLGSHPLVAPTVVQAILSFLTVVGNSIVLFAILRPKNRYRLRTPTNLLLANLAVIDCIRGLMTTPFTLVLFWVHIYNRGACGFIVSANLAMGKMTTMAYVVVTLERFLAIRFPFNYQRWSTHRHLAVVVICLWSLGLTYGVVIGSLGVKHHWNQRVGCIFAIVIPVEYLVYFAVLGTYVIEYAIMVAVYSYIIVIARRHRRQLARLNIVAPPMDADSTSQSDGQDTTSGGTVGEGVNRKIAASTAPKTREVNRSLRCLFLLVVHFLCNWPICIYDILKLWAHIGHHMTVVSCLVVLKNVNSCINPALYMMTNRVLREEVMTLLSCFRCQPKTNQIAPFNTNNIAIVSRREGESAK